MDDLTVYDMTAICRECRDLFTVFVRVRRSRPDGTRTRWLQQPEKVETVRGWLERSSSYHWAHGHVVHRCGGRADVYGDFSYLRILVEG
jgi:hypothetical protein